MEHETEHTGVRSRQGGRPDVRVLALLFSHFCGAGIINPCLRPYVRRMRRPSLPRVHAANRIRRAEATAKLEAPQWISSFCSMARVGLTRPRHVHRFARSGRNFSTRRLKMYIKPAVQWPCTKPRFLAQPKQKQDLPGPTTRTMLGPFLRQTMAQPARIASAQCLSSSQINMSVHRWKSDNTCMPKAQSTYDKKKSTVHIIFS
jgi:hypothetical protein